MPRDVTSLAFWKGRIYCDAGLGEVNRCKSLRFSVVNGLFRFGTDIDSGQIPNARRNRESREKSVAVIERNVRALIVAHINLAGASDLLFGIEQHLFPLRDPAAGARDSE